MIIQSLIISSSSLLFLFALPFLLLPLRGVGPAQIPAYRESPSVRAQCNTRLSWLRGPWGPRVYWGWGMPSGTSFYPLSCWGSCSGPGVAPWHSGWTLSCQAERMTKNIIYKSDLKLRDEWMGWMKWMDRWTYGTDEWMNGWMDEGIDAWIAHGWLPG